MSSTILDVLEHLRKYPYNMDAMVAQKESSQVGISEGIGRDRSFVSRVLNELKEEDLIFSVKRHVKGSQKRVKVYYVTPLGEENFRKMRKGEEQSSFPIISAEKPDPTYFVGREEELGTIRQWISSSDPRTFVIKGMAGVGKTTLVSKALDPYTNETNMFWIDLRPWSSPHSILLRLSQHFSLMGKTILKDFISQNSYDIEQISFILEKEFKDLDMICVFDNYKNEYSLDVLELISLIVDLLQKEKDTRAIIISRGTPKFMERTTPPFPATSLILECLNEEDSMNILEHESVDPEQHSKLFSISKGHPLALQLLAKYGAEGEIMTGSYLEESISSSLSPIENIILEVASILRNPVEAEVLLEISHELGYKNIEKATVYSMVNRSLLYAVGQKYAIHDLIRDLFTSKISTLPANEYHHTIAEYYLKEREPEGILKALYHFGKAIEYKRAYQILKDHGTDLIAKGFWTEALESIGQIYAELNELEKAELLLQKGYIYRIILGKKYEAISSYEEAKNIFISHRDVRGEIKAYHGLGFCYIGLSNYDKAITYFDKCLEKISDPEGSEILSDIYVDRGVALGRIGRKDEGIRELKKGLEHYKKTGFGNIYRIYEKMALIYTDKGDLKKAIELIEKHLIDNDDVDKQILLNAYNLLGMTYYLLGDHTKSISLLEKTINMAEDMGNVRVLSYALSNISEVYLDIGDLVKAEEQVRKVLPLCKKIDAMDVYENSLMAYALILSEKGDLEKSKEAFEEMIGSKPQEAYVYGQALMHYGKLLYKMGNKEDAKKNLEESKKIFDDLGSENFKDKVVETMKELGL